MSDATVDAVLLIGADMLRESPALLAEFSGLNHYLHSPLNTDHDTLARDRAAHTDVSVVDDLWIPFLQHKHVLVFASNAIYYVSKRLACIAAHLVENQGEGHARMTIIAVGHVYGVSTTFQSLGRQCRAAIDITEYSIRVQT